MASVTLGLWDLVSRATIEDPQTNDLQCDIPKLALNETDGVDRHNFI